MARSNELNIKVGLFFVGNLDQVKGIAKQLETALNGAMGGVGDINAPSKGKKKQAPVGQQSLFPDYGQQQAFPGLADALKQAEKDLTKFAKSFDLFIKDITAKMTAKIPFKGLADGLNDAKALLGKNIDFKATITPEISVTKKSRNEALKTITDALKPQSGEKPIPVQVNASANAKFSEFNPNQFNKAIKGMNDAAKKLTAILKINAQIALDTTGNTAKQAVDGIRAQIESAAKSLKAIPVPVNANAKTTFGNINADIEKALKGAAKKIKTASVPVKVYAKASFNDFNPNQFGKAIKDMNDAAKKITVLLKMNARIALDTAGQSAKQVVDGIKTQIENAAKGIKAFAFPANFSVKANVVDLNASVEKAVQGAVKGLKTLTVPVNANIKATVTDLGAGIEKAIQASAKGLKAFSVPVNTNAKATFGAIGAEIDKALQGAAKGLKTSTVPIKAHIKAVFNAFNANQLGAAIKAIQKAADGITALVAVKAKISLAPIIDGVKGEIKAAVTLMEKEAKSVVPFLEFSPKVSIAKAINQIKQAVAGVKAQIESEAKNATANVALKIIPNVKDIDLGKLEKTIAKRAPKTAAISMNAKAKLTADGKNIQGAVKYIKGLIETEAKKAVPKLEFSASAPKIKLLGKPIADIEKALGKVSAEAVNATKALVALGDVKGLPKVIAKLDQIAKSLDKVILKAKEAATALGGLGAGTSLPAQASLDRVNASLSQMLTTMTALAGLRFPNLPSGGMGGAGGGGRGGAGIPAFQNQNLANAYSGLTTAIAGVRRATNVFTGAISKAASSASNFVEAFNNAIIKFNVMYYGLPNVAQTLAGPFKPGFEFESSMQSSQLGMAAIISQMGRRDGERISFEESMGVAEGLLQRLNAKAIQTAASTKDLVETFRGLAAPGLGAGFDLKQLEEYTTIGVNAAKAMSLPSTQFIQELRDLVQGGIQTASSTIATSLGLRDADIKRMKQSARGLFAELMDHMAAFKYMDAYYPTTLPGMVSQIEEYATLASAKFTQAFENEIKYVMKAIQNAFGSLKYDDAGSLIGFEVNPAIMGILDAMRTAIAQLTVVWNEFISNFGSFDINGVFTPNEQGLVLWDSIKTLIEKIWTTVLLVGEAFVAWTPALTGVVEGLADGAGRLLDMVNAALLYLTEMGRGVTETETIRDTVADIVEVMGVVAAIGKIIIGAFTLIRGIVLAIGTAWNFVVGPLSTAWEIAKKFLGTIVRIGRTLGTIGRIALASPAAAAILGIVGVGGSAIGMSAAGLSFDDMLKGLEKGLLEDTPEKEEKGFLDSLLPDVSKIQEEMRKKFDVKIPEPPEKDKKPISDDDLRNIKGVPKVDEQAAKKAADESRRAERSRTKEILAMLKASLKEQLRMFEDAMKKVDLLYKQNRISWEEYFQAQGENDKNIADAKVANLQAQIQAIRNSGQYQNEEERNADLAPLLEELRDQTEEQKRATAQMGELGQVILRSNTGIMQSMASWQSALQKQAGRPSQGGQLAGYNGDDPKAYAVKMADKYGVAADLFMALIQAESNWNAEAQSWAGAYGYTQLMPDTAARLGVDKYDWKQNIEGGAKLLAQLLQTFNGNVEHALAGYNAGPGAVMDYGGIPPYPETQAYVPKILGFREEYTAEVEAIRQSLGNAAQSISQATGKYLSAETMAQLQSLWAQGKTGEGIFWEKSPDLAPERITGLMPGVTKIIDIIGAYYKELTGKLGDPQIAVLTSADRPAELYGYDQNGHKNHLKFDIADSWNGTYLENNIDGIRTALLELGDAIGAVGGDEYADPVPWATGGHLDFNTEQTGPEQILANFLAANGAISDWTSTINTNFVALTEKAYEAKQAAQKVKELVDEVQEARDNIEGNTERAEIKKIDSEWLEGDNAKIKTLKAELAYAIKKGDQAMIDTYQTAVDNALYIANHLKMQAGYRQASQDLDTALKVIEHNAKNMAKWIGEDFLYFGSNLGGIAKKYMDYSFNGKNTPIPLLDIKNRLKEQMDAAELANDKDLYIEMRNAYESIDEALRSHIDDFAESVKSGASWVNEMIDEQFTWTDRQKEYAKNDTEYKQYNRLAELERAKGLSKEQEILAEIARLKEKINELDKEAADYAQKKADLEAKIAEQMKDTSATESYRQAALYAKKAENANRKMVGTFEEAKQAGKQAFEDGLVTFFTDGINEAESLGEAVRNLALDILKSMQKVFAENLARSFSDMLWGTGDKSIGRTNEDKTNAETIGQRNLAYQEYGMAVPQDPWNMAGSPVPAGDLIAQSAQTVGQSIAQAGQTASMALTESGNSLAQGGQMASMAINELATGVQMAGNALVGAINSVASSLSVGTASAGTSEAYASGGYISGKGTGTSDSIRAWLSNGEFVVKAQSVKKYGVDMLNRINSGTFGNLRVRIPAFAGGGLVGDAGASVAGKFADSFTASMKPEIQIMNYVDGKRVMSTDEIRTIVREVNMKDAKMNGIMSRRTR